MDNNFNSKLFGSFDRDKRFESEGRKQLEQHLFGKTQFKKEARMHLKPPPLLRGSLVFVFAILLFASGVIELHAKELRKGKLSLIHI